jgi:hypothetical protein
MRAVSSGIGSCSPRPTRAATSRSSRAAFKRSARPHASPSRTPDEASPSLSIPRHALGLTNLTAQARGVETSLATTIRAREARFALGRLLRERGVATEAGEEMRSINRRQARAGLRAIAERALALRSLPPPTDAEISRHEAEARERYALVRRFSLPRNMLARLVETAVVLDRASALEERGHHVAIVRLFDRATTPRNIGLFASRDETRLPRAI